MKYIPIRPEDRFKVAVERTVKHDSPDKIHYEYTYTVEVVPSECSFLNLFAALVVRHGNRNTSFYAPAMGIEEYQLHVTLQTLSGAGIRNWTDAYANVMAETLLRETDWRVGRIAQEAHFLSTTTFDRFFHRTHHTTPKQWRKSKRGLKK